MSKALYRKYRSRSLDEIVGQPHITGILKRAIARGAAAHAYLLTGPRGVGKTSVARILAHEINGLPYTGEATHLDIIEIDAASNNSVEDIRDLREKVQIAPVSAPNKVYIIDEVHMLSKSAFNALLKTLEEPPEHVVFILATTDADKLPATILSRVQRFNFRLISEVDAASHLRMIADAENIAIDDDALRLIAEQGQGSFRDSISLLDQMQHIAADKITAQLIEESLGLASAREIDELLQACAAGDLTKITRLLEAMERSGVPATIAADQIARQIRRSAASRPNQLALLDSLFKVARSPWPYISLLAALAPAADSAPKTPEKSPVSDAGIASRRTDNIPKTPEKSPAKPLEPVTNDAAAEAPASPASAEKPAKRAKKTPKSSKNSAKSAANQPFPWNDFLAPLKESAAGAHSILVKCGYSYDDGELTIYAGKKFAKTQIDKAQPAMAQALQAIDRADTEITVLAAPKPPEDSQAAAVIAIMGGGEEVSL